MTRNARAEIDTSKFNGSQLPNGFDMSRGGNVMMEISQKGAFDTLDAKEGWAKIYLDPSRALNGVIGIFGGYYSGCHEDMNGTTGGKYSIEGVCNPDKGAATYEFFVGIEKPPLPLDPDPIYKNKIDEFPCTHPFATVSSRNMYQDGYHENPVNNTGWYQLALKDYTDKKCEMKPTLKSGKVVVFVHTYWNDAANKEGRINAFKIGGAYNDKLSPSSALTGYWSRLESAVRPTTLLDFDTGSGVYAVQDRRTPQDANQSPQNANGWTQGDYNFSFGPDCDITKGTQDPKKRYIKWYDVDYSTDSSKSFYNGKTPPSMRLVDKTTGKTVINADTNKPIAYSGAELGGPDTPRDAAFYGIGGHIYGWEWKNIIASDGVVFWMPYDDYPSLGGGCGTYNQAVDIQGTRGDGWHMKDSTFEVAGGDTVTFLVRGKYTGGTGAAPTSTFGAHLVSQPGSLYDGTFTGAGPTSISDDGYKKNGSRANIEWVKPGMGPNSPYASQRDLYFSYKVKGDAQDGAKHCFNADLTPISNTNPTGSARSGSVCIVVNNSLKPYVGTSGADVHAGDCRYIDPTKGFGVGLGKITGPKVNGLNEGSSGQYIVSAADAITNFGSGGSPGDSKLTFGKGGHYGSMCRPTMDKMDPNLERGVQKIDGDARVVNGQFDIGTLGAGSRYAVTFHQNVTVIGTAKASMTLYAEANTITIQAKSGTNTFGSDVDSKNKYARNQLPTVGVTAKNIKISNSVVGLTAALYADQNITTCAENTVAACRSTLLLNGFAMAHDFTLNRVGTGKNGLQLAEYLKFNPAIYLNPPPGDGTVGDMAQYLGERAPLY